MLAGRLAMPRPLRWRRLCLRSPGSDHKASAQPISRDVLAILRAVSDWGCGVPGLAWLTSRQSREQVLASRGHEGHRPPRQRRCHHRRQSAVRVSPSSVSSCGDFSDGVSGSVPVWLMIRLLGPCVPCATPPQCAVMCCVDGASMVTERCIWRSTRSKITSAVPTAPASRARMFAQPTQRSKALASITALATTHSAITTRKIAMRIQPTLRTVLQRDGFICSIME
jgi:hypothetical protein